MSKIGFSHAIKFENMNVQRGVIVARIPRHAAQATQHGGLHPRLAPHLRAVLLHAPAAAAAGRAGARRGGAAAAPATRAQPVPAGSHGAGSCPQNQTDCFSDLTTFILANGV